MYIYTSDKNPLLNIATQPKRYVMPKQTRELTVDEKWYRVDQAIRGIESRKKNGDKEPCKTDLDEYLDYHFNGGMNRDE